MVFSNTTEFGFPVAGIRNVNSLGKSNWAGDPYFNGQTDDFRAYAKILSCQDIIYLHNTHKSVCHVE